MLGDFTEKNLRIVNISKLKYFTDFPFNLDTDTEMQALAFSIKQNGVWEPIIVRPIKSAVYTHEIISGHRRVIACNLAGQTEVTCDIRDLDDNQATILMVDSTLTNRKEIKPSEKAKAYRMRSDALKSQGKRTDLTLDQVGPKLKHHKDELIGDEYGESASQVKRYIRLNELIPSLLQKLDDRKIAFTPCVELSYLSKDQQQDLFTVLECEDKYDVPLKVASKLKNIAQNGNLTDEKIQTIVTKDFSKSPKNYKISYSSVTKYFDKDVTPSEVNDTIDKALALWMKMRPSKSTKPKDHER